MVRKLKHHEQKLLRKVDFTTYKADPSHRSAAICRRYAIQNPDDYTKYNRLCGKIRQLTHALSLLPPTSPFRTSHTHLLLQKLHFLGIIPSPTPSSLPTSLSAISKLSVSRIARRRIGVVMARSGMVDSVHTANKFLVQGHVRVGTEVCTDPAMLVSRAMEDWLGWVRGSKVGRKVEGWKGGGDDFGG